jgi:exonuclease SbcC
MIIHGLQAENLLKYARLTLDALPNEGQIGVSGPNESGKTSIGELLCLGLFGRTYSLGPEDLARVVKWGEARGRVEVKFSGHEDRQYAVVRYLDSSGRQEAMLTAGEEAVARGVEAVNRAVEERIGFGYEMWVDTFYLAQREITLPHSQGPTVKSVVGVSELERVGRELEAEIEDEREAMERLQREVTDLQLQLTELNIEEEALARLQEERAARLQAVEARAHEGQALEQVKTQVQQALGRVRESVQGLLSLSPDPSYSEWREAANSLSAALSDLDRSYAPVETDSDLILAQRLRRLDESLDGHLQGFGQLRDEAIAHRERLVKTLEALDAGSAPLTEQGAAARSHLEQLTRRRSSARFVSGLFLVFALVLWAGWGLLTFLPGTRAAETLTAGVQQAVPGWQPASNPSQLLVLAIVATVITLLDLWFFSRGSAFSGRIEEIQDEVEDLERHMAYVRSQAELLDNLDHRPLREAMATLRAIPDLGAAEMFDAFAGGPYNPLLDERGEREFREELQAALNEAEEEVVALSRDIEEQDAEVRREIEGQRKEILRLDAAIADEHERRARASEITQLTGDLQLAIAEHQDRIRVRQAAQEWVGRASRHLMTHFNRDMRGAVAQILPLLTEGRYQYLQIGEDLEPRVFSAEKNDFMGVAEISSGTQRQITLATRLALALALAETAVQGPQSVVLDEPFAFFDRPRARSTLLSLPQLSRYFAQVWVISQDFDEDIPFDMHIRCSRESDTLIACGS